MAMNCSVLNRYSLQFGTALVLGVLSYADLNAQDRFPVAGQAQAGAPITSVQPPLQHTHPGSFPSQSDNPSARGGFQMPSSPSQIQSESPLAHRELQDFGVPPTEQLHAGAMHGPTPVKIPGGRVTTTDELAAALRQGQQQVLLFHVLGGQEMLPGAQYAAPASAPGTFNDETQRAFSQYLNQVTQGQKNRALVFYCASVQCWMSYNAALRAINSGYSNVLWYRGGIEAWKAAGLPTSSQR